MRAKPKGFGPDRTNIEDVEQAMKKFATGLKTDIESLQHLMATPSGQGEMDALLGKPITSDDPNYKAAYDQMQVTKLLASPEQTQMLEAMQPFIKDLLRVLCP